MTATMASITEEVSRQTDVSLEYLRGPMRWPHVVEARHMAMFLAREITGYSQIRIARALGRTDHTTVRHACRRMRDRMRSDPALANRLLAIKAKFAPPTRT